MTISTHTFAAPALIALILAGATMAEAKGPRHGPDFGFEELDTDGDGLVTQADLDAVAAARFAEADADGDGFLSADELSQRAGDRAGERAAKRSARMLERLDTDGDGKLSAEELTAGRRGGGMIGRLDADGDAAISAEEFEAAKERFAKRRDHGGTGRHGDRDGGPRAN